jgi:cytochrome c peroxidase
MRAGKLIAAAAFIWLGSLALHAGPQDDRGADKDLNDRLAKVLKHNGFTGDIQSQLESRLGRSIDEELANLGRLLWYDPVHSLHQDNTCAGCHSPSNGFGDTQSIAIGVDNNNKVGPGRTGPRNQRRSPMVINAAFYPKLMWNGRFSAVPKPGQALGNPFTNKYGFEFPQPEGTSMFRPNDPIAMHLLHAQAFIPPTELVEVAGFTGTAGTLGPLFDQFDNGKGHVVPLPDASGFRNDPIRAEALTLIDQVPEYRARFGKLFPRARTNGIDFAMMGRAIAEFEFTLTFADAPLDQFARGERDAMTSAEKRGALVFFGEGKCVMCHAVDGKSNEMFSDFQNRVAGIPQLVPQFGVGKSNMVYDGPGANEDFGLEQVTGDPADRYKFRTAPLRNAALAPAYFHNGSFTRLEDAIRYHLNPERFGPIYNAANAGVAVDLRIRPQGPIDPVLARLDPELRGGIRLRESEITDLIAFVRNGLLDSRAKKENLCSLVPAKLPSGLKPLNIEGCK